MVTLRVIRNDRYEQLLAECRSPVLPARGEVLQLDTLDGHGGFSGPSTLWRVVSVTLNVPSVHSAAPADGSALSVRQVEVRVVPDAELLPHVAAAQREILSESKL